MSPADASLLHPFTFVTAAFIVYGMYAAVSYLSWEKRRFVYTFGALWIMGIFLNYHGIEGLFVLPGLALCLSATAWFMMGAMETARRLQIMEPVAAWMNNMQQPGGYAMQFTGVRAAAGSPGMQAFQAPLGDVPGQASHPLHGPASPVPPHVDGPNGMH